MLVLLFLASPALAETLHYADDLYVYDAAGKRIGRAWPGVEALSGTLQQPVAMRTHDGRAFTLHAQHRTFRGDAYHVYFVSTDCTGNPFLNSSSGAVGRSATVVGPRQTLYVQAGRPAWRRMYSVLRSEDGTCAPALPGRYWYDEFARATRETDLADHFTPPYRLGARGEELVSEGAE